MFASKDRTEPVLPKVVGGSGEAVDGRFPARAQASKVRLADHPVVTGDVWSRLEVIIADWCCSKNRWANK
jgi:hypothetical protein